MHDNAWVKILSRILIEETTRAMAVAKAGDVEFGEGKPLVLIAGPCVIESRELCIEVGSRVAQIAKELGVPYIFKSSFDKANRTSVQSYRGPGLEKGLEILGDVKSRLQVPVLTDVHEVWQVKPASQVVDILQIPAFLCRQTDLIVAAAETGKCVNIKKGQFQAPWDMKNSVDKARSTGNYNICVTERGVSFGYNTLVVDMTSLPILRSLGCAVVFDATHSVQRPGGMGQCSGGAREFIPYLARAAAAVGIDALFMEVHPDPDKALCDAASMLSLAELPSVLSDVLAIRRALGETCGNG
jgi:2-dehydro-3-deoxyphosphooctonate aldolase (KDO 8-P synthase)